MIKFKDFINESTALNRRSFEKIKDRFSKQVIKITDKFPETGKTEGFDGRGNASKETKVVNIYYNIKGDGSEAIIHIGLPVDDTISIADIKNANKKIEKLVNKLFEGNNIVEYKTNMLEDDNVAGLYFTIDAKILAENMPFTFVDIKGKPEVYYNSFGIDIDMYYKSKLGEKEIYCASISIPESRAKRVTAILKFKLDFDRETLNQFKKSDFDEAVKVIKKETGIRSKFEFVRDDYGNEIVTEIKFSEVSELSNILDKLKLPQLEKRIATLMNKDKYDLFPNFQN